LHYDERRGLYKHLGIDIKPDNEKPKTGIKNHIKRKINEIEKQQGGE